LKTAGIVGGIGPEATIQYYQLIVKLYRERTGDGSYPSVLVNSIDVTKMLGLIGEGRLKEVTDYLLAEIERLARAGAHFGALAANTPHIVFEPLQDRVSIPLISIVDATRESAVARDVHRTGLFGTPFTMQAAFYPEGLARAGISVVLPSAAEQEYIHDRYVSELLNGVFREETRQGLAAIARRLKYEEKIDALILGGTELPLILRDEADVDVPLLDTTRIHVEAIVAGLLS